MPIRPYTSSDLPALHAINVAGEPGVGPVSQDELDAILAEGTCFVSVDAGAEPDGFILLVAPGADYHSPNFRWFEERLLSGTAPDFIYVDRIAIAASAQGEGLGAALYETAFDAFRGKTGAITCEVNTLPPNPGSIRFHERLGFKPVGEQVFTPGKKAVVYLERAL